MAKIQMLWMSYEGDSDQVIAEMHRLLDAVRDKPREMHVRLEGPRTARLVATKPSEQSAAKKK